MTTTAPRGRGNQPTKADDARRAKALAALEENQRRSLEAGTDQMTASEIAAEIRKARRSAAR